MLRKVLILLLGIVCIVVQMDWSCNLTATAEAFDLFGSSQTDAESIALNNAAKEILNGAASRIEKYRMANATIKVVASNGGAVSDAEVKIEQLNHEFSFGANHSIKLWPMLVAEDLRIQAEKRLSSTQPELSQAPGIPQHFEQVIGQSNKQPGLSEEQMDRLKRQFYDFANYTSLPVGWSIYEKDQGVIHYDEYDAVIDALHEKGLKVLAHQLVWNNNTPSWVPDDCTEMNQAIEKRVKDFVTHYKDKFDYFLVANEMANPFRANFMKDKMTACIAEVGKIPFVIKQFKTAREAAPDAKLMINEVSVLEKQGFPELLRSLKDENGKPYYDVIGIQTHMHASIWPLDAIWKLCEGYATFGVPLHFTEVSVLSGSPLFGKDFGKETTPEGEKLQAQYVVNLYTVLFSHPAVEAIQWWNLSDYMAWKGAPAGLLRKDMTPKPAYTALLDLIKNKWWTKVQATTTGEGQCGFKGFFGKYRITVTPKGGVAKTFDIELTKKGGRQFQLTL